MEQTATKLDLISGKFEFNRFLFLCSKKILSHFRGIKDMKFFYNKSRKIKLRKKNF